MRTTKMLAGLALLVVGLALATAVLYDATELTRLAGLAPEGGEAVVALGGLVLAGAALCAGGRTLRRARPASADAA